MTRRKNRKTTRRKAPKRKTGTNYKIINILLVIIIFLILIIGFLLYNFDTKNLKEVNNKTKEITKKVEKTVQTANKQIDTYIEKVELKKDKFEEYTKDFYEEYVDKETVKKLKEQIDKVEQELKKETPKEKPPKEEKKQPVITTSKKPKLAIVIDDVTTQYQLNQIKKIGFRVSPSFMPPTKRHPNSADIAKDEKFYMIHFPMQAQSFKNEENSTLHTNDSYEKIEKRVAQIRQWYPEAKYTNNHTGSKFTENKEAMDKLFKALVKYNFIFVDSRTTSKTVAKQMAEKYKMPYLVRNVFLDNEQDFEYIQNQLKKAIEIAKKNGYAIAICHPHSVTMKTLRKSKHLLKDLDLVYINQLPILYK